MHVGIKAVDVCAIETFVMVAADENLMLMRQVAKPVQEVNGLLLRAIHGEIAGVYHNIRIRQHAHTSMATVSVRYV